MLLLLWVSCFTGFFPHEIVLFFSLSPVHFKLHQKYIPHMSFLVSASPAATFLWRPKHCLVAFITYYSLVSLDFFYFHCFHNKQPCT